MTSTETVKNLLTELIDMIDNGSQRDLDRADEISTSIIKMFEQESTDSSGLMTVDEFVERKVNRTLDKIKTEANAECISDEFGRYIRFDVLENIINKYKTKNENTDRKMGRWTPISEGLPKETGWYLITFKTYDGDYAVSEMCYRKPENYWTDKDITKKVFDNSEVEAWTPKPYPYRPQKVSE